jgi:4-hydroxy-3-methylbut-2-enyl diphosphate reductase
VQRIIEEHANQGYSTVIVGDEGHAEVIGLLGYANGNGYVISSPDDIPGLPDMEKVCVVAQTTQEMRTYALTVEKLKERYKNNEIFETICSSTTKRQKEVISLSKSVDAMIVVGGRNSANTNRLAQISAQEGTPTFLIESEEELELKKLADFGSVGVTAGASTPNWLIQNIVDKVQAVQAEETGRIRGFFEKTTNFLTGSFTYIAIGAASLSYASSTLLGLGPKLSSCAIATLLLFSMYVLNHFANKKAVAIKEPSKAKLYERHQGLFESLGFVAAVTSLVLAFMVNIEVFICVFIAIIFGFAYRISIIPKRFYSIIRYSSLEQIPGSKEVFISMAWAVSVGLIPFLGTTVHYLSALPVVLTFTFSITFIRTVLLDVKDVQGDKMIGREAISIAIGKRNTQINLIVILAVLAVLLIVSPILGWTSSFSFYLLPCVIYACVYLYLYHKRLIPSGVAFEAITDFNFILAGIMVVIWHLLGH